MTLPVRAFVGLGSNLSMPAAQIERAFEALAALPGTVLERRSALYRTAPVGYEQQPDFVNAVAQLRTVLDASTLLQSLLAIERAHGRVRTVRDGPRTLDLDLLVHGDAVIDSPGLQVPHPRMRERAFVMVPLAEIAPGFTFPDGGRVDEIARRLEARQRIEPLGRDVLA